MADDSTGFFSNLRSYANEYIETKRRNLEAKPQTQVEGGGSGYSVTFSGQDISQSDLRDVKQIRESGGIISQVFHSKALIKFGTGTEIQAESDDLEQWLQENVGPIDDLALDLGEDALWYPYGLAETVETRRGEFSHIECIEPWTMLPRTDEFGDITRWEQHLKGDFANPPTFDPEEIGSIIINKSSGRDKTGISEALRSQEEIETFRANQQAMREATERIGYPFVHAKAGREGATQLNDNELRRIRNRLADIGPGETQVTGPDVDINLKEPATVDFGEIQERDMRMLATSLGVPVELLNHGSDGLGSGMPAELRKDLLALQNEADRRRFSEQFVAEFLRPIVRKYSPFDHTQDMEVVFDPFLDDKTDMASLIQSVGDYMTANEARSKLGLSDLEDEEMGEGFQTPAEQEKPEEEQGGGLFGSDGRKLQVPDNAVSIQDPSEAPEDAEIIRGNRGGLYYVPAGEAGSEDGDKLSPDEITEASEIEADNIEFDTEDIGDETKYSFHALDEEVQFDMGVPDEEGGSAMAYHMWIGEGQRGEGVATELMEAAEMKARESGMDNLNATMGGDADVASSFFESLGFEQGIIEDGELIEPEGAEWAYAHKPLDGGERENASDTDFRGLAEIPDKYVEDTGLSEDDFVPNESILDVIEPTMEFIDEEGLPNPDDQQEGAARINQLKDHIDNNEPLAPEFWQEIANFHSRHRAQGNNECDESSLPEKAEEVDFDKCHFDNGWFSNRTWGGDPAFEQAQRIVEAIEDTEGVELSGGTDFRHSVETDGWEAWEHTLFELQHGIAHGDSDRHLTELTESQVPDFVKDRIRDAIFSDTLFSQFDTIADNDIMQLRNFMEEQLTKDGWTTDGIAGRLQDLEPELTDSEAERIARTETQALVNDAREEGYRETGMVEDETFYWTGATKDEQPNRTTEACDWLIKQTNPNHGGDPVSLERLKELIIEANERDDDINHEPREYTPHINCRKTYVRDV